jgi:hypothetical protein
MAKSARYQVRLDPAQDSELLEVLHSGIYDNAAAGIRALCREALLYRKHHHIHGFLPSPALAPPASPILTVQPPEPPSTAVSASLLAATNDMLIEEFSFGANGG